MRKSIQKWAYALVTCAFALALCVSFSACSSDDDNNGTDGIVPVLFSEFDGHYSVLYPLGLTNESVFVNISETLAGQQIDLTKPGDWWKSHTNLTHPGKYFRPSKVKIMRPTSPK